MHPLLRHLREETQRLLAVGGKGREENNGDAASASGLWRGLALLVLGTACYGASIGLWRAPQQALFVAIKMPLLILLTLFLNGLLNGMLAAIMGTGLGFAQTMLAIGRSFALFGLIVGALGPPAAFFTVTLPGWGEPGGFQTYRVLLLAHTGVIAAGGVLANWRLYRSLTPVCGRRAARRALIAWLIGNLFVGAQLSYTLRPFFGNPDLPVQFLRPNAFQGNFYEAIWRLSRHAFDDLFR